jgi:hypothetical protein
MFQGGGTPDSIILQNFWYLGKIYVITYVVLSFHEK